MADVVALYRSLSTQSLIDLQWAFQQDRKVLLDPLSLAFVDDRLRLIGAELKAREHDARVRDPQPS